MSRKALAQHLLDLEVRVGRTVDPLALLMEMSMGVDDYGSQLAERLERAGIISRGSKEWFELTEVSREVRVDAAKAALKYVHELAGKTNEPEDPENRIGANEIRKMIASDEIAESMEEIQFKLAEGRRKAHELQRQKEIESGE